MSLGGDDMGRKDMPWDVPIGPLYLVVSYVANFFFVKYGLPRMHVDVPPEGMAVLWLLSPISLPVMLLMIILAVFLKGVVWIFA